MESFGLFNFLKSAFSASPSPESGEEIPERPSSGNSGGSFFDFNPADLLKTAFSVPTKNPESGTEKETQKQPPADRENNPETAAPSEADASILPQQANFPDKEASPESNPFLALMERHERMAKNIDKRSPKK